MEKKTAAYIAALSMSVIIGFSFFTNKISLNTASPYAILAHRFTFAFLGLLILKAFGFLKIKMERKEFLEILPLSLFYPLIFFSLQILGLQRVFSSEAGIIQAITPLMTMVLATVILKEKTARKQKNFMLLSLTGVVYISLMKGAELSLSSLTGYVLLLLSSLSSATNLVLIRKFVKNHSFMKLTTVSITTGFIIFNLLNLVLHLNEGTLHTYFQPLRTPSFLLAVIFLGMASTLGTSLLSNFALSRLETSRISIFNHLGTVISIFAGVLLLQEHLSYYQVIGAVLIIIGVIGTNYYGSNQAKRS